MAPTAWRFAGWRLGHVLACSALLLAGCGAFAPAVQVRQVSPGEYVKLKRGDIITSGKLSAATRESLDMAGLGTGACADLAPPCMADVKTAIALDDEQRHSALAELWVAYAMAQGRPSQGGDGEAALFNAWMEAARHSYIYLFFSGRAATGRLFEDRHTQVRDYYNLATQETGRLLFEQYKHASRDTGEETFRFADWTVRLNMDGVRFPGAAPRPNELVPISSLSFAGLRSIYRRDGLGAEMLTVTPNADQVAEHDTARPLLLSGTGQPVAWGMGYWSEMPAPLTTSLTLFPGDTADAVQRTHEVLYKVYDPYTTEVTQVRGQEVPLAANFSAGYGLWLARSGFSEQSVETLIGGGTRIDRPHLYLLQPYDPHRRVLLLVHGLASSPEAWANVANELLGDEALRKRYQIWQFYYPTNVHMAFNHFAMRRTLEAVQRQLDPGRNDPASHGMVLVGHSMGGVISRLMVSSAHDELVTMVRNFQDMDDEEIARVVATVGPVLQFEPLPQVERAIFLAAPHRGTDFAGGWLVRTIGSMVTRPNELAAGLSGLLKNRPDRQIKALPTSVQNLDKNDPFIQAASRLPIAPGLHYHSVIAQRDTAVPLAQSDDGLVPYWSAHLDGAVSEKVLPSGHSVQETAAAIIELRRILHEDVKAYEALGCKGPAWPKACH